jgi:dCMP deaminase
MGERNNLSSCLEYVHNNLESGCSCSYTQNFNNNPNCQHETDKLENVISTKRSIDEQRIYADYNNIQVFSHLDENPLSWDEYFMNIAILASLRSKDTTKVGAVIVHDRKILGVGYNGFPSGIDESKLPTGRDGEWLDTKYPYVVHAELNAILNTVQHNIQGSSLYVTMFPCCTCMTTILQKKISEIIYLSDKHHNDKEYIASRRLLSLTNIVIRQYEGDILL